MAHYCVPTRREGRCTLAGREPLGGGRCPLAWDAMLGGAAGAGAAAANPRIGPERNFDFADRSN